MAKRIEKKKTLDGEGFIKHKKPKVKTQLQFDPKPSTSQEEDDVICPGCGQSFQDNWIQCGICNEWWHEACSAYEGDGPFICDHC